MYLCEIWITPVCGDGKWRRVEHDELEMDEAGEVDETGRKIPVLANVAIEGRKVSLGFQEKIRFHDEDCIELRPIADP